jgi:hypothetical protein
MSKKTQLLLGVMGLGLLDAIIPFFPILSLILIYVLLAKPSWFLEIVREVYNTK